jgi:hypothetical protein
VLKKHARFTYVPEFNPNEPAERQRASEKGKIIAAGAIAEKLHFGDISDGAKGDMAKLRQFMTFPVFRGALEPELSADFPGTEKLLKQYSAGLVRIWEKAYSELTRLGLDREQPFGEKPVLPEEDVRRLFLGE